MEDTAITSGPECLIVTLKISDSCGGKWPRILFPSALCTCKAAFWRAKVRRSVNVNRKLNSATA
jgi:hypothetical protein